MRKLIPLLFIVTSLFTFAQAEEPAQLQTPSKILTWENVVESVCQHVKNSAQVQKIGDTADKIFSELSADRRKVLVQLKRTREEIDKANEQMSDASRIDAAKLIAIKEKLSGIASENEKEFKSTVEEWLKSFGEAKITVDNDSIRAGFFIEKNPYELEFNVMNDSFELKKLRVDRPEETRYAIRSITSILKKTYKEDPKLSVRWPDGSELNTKNVHLDFGLRLRGKLNDPQYRISFSATESGCETIVAAKLHDAFSSSEIPEIGDQPFFIQSKISQK